MNGFMIMWLLFVLLFLFLELSTVNLVSVWFVAGATCALLVAALGLSLGVQIGVFIAVTALLLIFTKPAVKKILLQKTHATNFDRIIGKEGIVTQKIEGAKGTGQIRVQGSVWSAKSDNGEDLEVDTRVEILRIEGVKAVVKAQPQNE